MTLPTTVRIVSHEGLEFHSADPSVGSGTVVVDPPQASDRLWAGAPWTAGDPVRGRRRSVTHGEFVLADERRFHLWHRSPYTCVYRGALPGFASADVSRVDVAMAGNEFRTRACGT